MTNKKHLRMTSCDELYHALIAITAWIYKQDYSSYRCKHVVVRGTPAISDQIRCVNQNHIDTNTQTSDVPEIQSKRMSYFAHLQYGLQG